MATKVTIALEDDLEGGAQYEIDLNKKNAHAFRKQLAPSSSTPAGPGVGSAAHAPLQPGSAAAASGPGPKSKVLR